MAKVAFLGMGMMGAGLAEAAVKRGDEVSIWNRSPDKTKPIEKLGARAFGTLREAVQGAERVHIVLSDDAAVDGVVAELEGALGSAIVVDHTTTLPAGTAARAKKMADLGVSFVHAPVFMSPAMCREGRGIMLASAPKAVFEKVADALRKMTGSLEYLGERPDLAAGYKLFGNSMILTITAGLADVFTLAASIGVSAEEAHALFAKFNPANVITYRGGSMAKGDYKASFELTMARKDARLMVETAAEAGRSLTVMPAVVAKMDELIGRGHGQDDLGVLSVDAVPKR